MRAGLRFRTILLAGALGLAPAAALAQETPPAATTNTPTTNTPTTNTPATDAIGPRELQNFKLPGTTTKPAPTQDNTAAPTPPTTRQSVPEQANAVARQSPAPRRALETRAPARQPDAAPVPSPALNPPPPAAASPASEMAPPLQVDSPPVLPQAPVESPLSGPAGPSLLPWILAAAALAAGAIFLFWQSRRRQAIAGGPQLDHFLAPEPQSTSPEPALPPPPPLPPRPVVPAPPKAPSGNGLVAARLRPAVEIGMRPLRCVVDDSQVVIEFEVELYNAGTAPARFVLAEASLMNASATQDQELAAFFSNPTGAGDRLDIIPPMKRIQLTSKVVAPRGAVHEYEMAGHKAFVPVIAFNALYEWSGGKGQTSAAYLVGRETHGDKLGPLRLDGGSREFRALDARTLPSALRT